MAVGGFRTIDLADPILFVAIKCCVANWPSAHKNSWIVDSSGMSGEISMIARVAPSGVQIKTFIVREKISFVV